MGASDFKASTNFTHQRLHTLRAGLTYSYLAAFRFF